MILHSIELQSVGPFAEKVHVGPLLPGLNILAAPNESGKTTALRAAARALFDKHTTKGDELKALQPAGTDLSPRVAVEFETRTGKFRIEKTFLNAPRSLLQRWQDDRWESIAEADAADRRVQELLSSALPGRGATKPEHWGMLGFLWARQGEPAEWPNLEDEAVGQRIRARLARVEIDPVIDQLRQRLLTLAEDVITSTGQVRKNGPLAQAESELAEMDAALSNLAKTRSEIEVSHQRYQHAAAAVTQLEKEHADRSTAAREMNELAASAERGKLELDARMVELASAQTKLNAIAQDSTTLTSRQGELTSATASLAKAEEIAKLAETRLVALRQEIDAQQTKRPEVEAAVSKLRTTQQRAQAILKLRQSTAQVVELARSLDRAESSTTTLVALKERQLKIPAINAAKLRKLEELTEKVRTLAAQVQAIGLTVELTPERASQITIQSAAGPGTQDLAPGQMALLHSPQSLDLDLSGWGRVMIRSGATEARDLAGSLRTEEDNLRAALQDAEVTSLDDARQAVTKRKELDSEIKAATAALAQQLGEHASLEALREVVAIARRKVESLASSLAPTNEESKCSLADLEGEEARLAEAIPAAEKMLKELDRDLTQLRTQEREAAESVQVSNNEAGKNRTLLKTLEAQIADVGSRYVEGLDAAKTKAQIEFTQAEARVAAAKAGLPPDFEKLPERNRRAAAALQQLENELQSRRAERDSANGALEMLGGQGIYSRETELEEKKAETILRRDAARNLGWSARIAHDLIEFRKQAATKAVLTPLEQRLTSAFADLTANASRQVFLDDTLQIAGLGRTREAIYPFNSLSQGAREQLLLCLRIAVAQELASDEPQTLILDDVLVNTDPVRQERILDVLGTQAERLQILILTCHPDRYRGVGESVSLLPETP